MALRWKDEVRALDLGVRDLLDAGEVDIRHGVAISQRARLAAGQEVHRAASADRGESYRSEVAIRWVTVVRGWTATVHGRIDGIEEDGPHTVIEEVKSTALPVDRLDEVEHFPEWEAQLAAYVFFAGEAHLPGVVGRLRVVSLVDGSTRLYTVGADPRIGERFRDRLDHLVAAREAWLFWQLQRRSRPAAFPFAVPRPGQEEIRAAAAAAVRGGRHLLLTAPTGLGKTAAVLTGVLEAAAERGLGVYWATARTTQQLLAEATVRAMVAEGARLRSVSLRAREKACLNGVVDCRPEVCRFADRYVERRDRGVLDRLAARATPNAEELAAEAAVDVLCPYELAWDWAARCDLIIGDYNQVFAPEVGGRSAFADREWVWVVDEAHQLPDRAVGYGSPALPSALVDAVLHTATGPEWAAIRQLAAAIGDEIRDAELRAVEPLTDCLLVELPLDRWRALRDRVDEVAWDHARLRAARPGPFDAEADNWTELGRAVIRFTDALERAGEETVSLWDNDGLRLYCRDPARILGPRFAAAHASVCLSATLHPTWYFQDRFGLPADRVDTLTVPSPFPPENRRVVVVPGVSTAFRHRARDRTRLATVVDEIVAAVPGNVAVYCGSYEQLADLLANSNLGGRERLVQRPDDDDAARAELLERIATPGPPRVLAAVLGGSFAEGVDLPREVLQAVLVIGPALPPPSTERRLLQAWYQERYEAGFELAFIRPGMTRVVQAAGRVVRGPEDRGTVVLVCERFLRTEFVRYLPADWVWTRARRGWLSVLSPTDSDRSRHGIANPGV